MKVRREEEDGFVQVVCRGVWMEEEDGCVWLGVHWWRGGQEEEDMKMGGFVVFFG